MRLTRVYTAESLQAPGQATLQDAAAAHVSRVLRLRAGDPLSLFNGDGWDYAGTIGSAQGGRLEVQLLSRQAGRPESPLELTLLQGLARGERMDLVIQKATELGVARIQPVLAERSVVRLDARQARGKLAHWRAVSISACEQCGRSRLPAIEAPLALAEVVASRTLPACRLLLEPGARQSLAALDAATRAAAVLIGPEGGFSDAELEAATGQGFAARSLGPRILRTETAAIAALAVLQAAAGDLS